jgi:phospholipid-binding lipoprotein MlaA
VRDTVGYTGDIFLDPLTYVFWDYWYWSFGTRAYETVNATSLRIGDYEKFKDASIDPYVAMRDAYTSTARPSSRARTKVLSP